MPSESRRELTEEGLPQEFDVACCPVHGLHGCRDTCFECGVPVRQVRVRVVPVSSERVTHGRHCVCSACAAQDWAEPSLAPCGMHGPSCPPLYAPIGAAGDVVPARPVVEATSDDDLLKEALQVFNRDRDQYGPECAFVTAAGVLRPVVEASGEREAADTREWTFDRFAIIVRAHLSELAGLTVVPKSRLDALAASAWAPDEAAQKAWADRVGAVVDQAHEENLGGRHCSGFCQACSDAYLVAQRAVPKDAASTRVPDEALQDDGPTAREAIAAYHGAVRRRQKAEADEPEATVEDAERLHAAIFDGSTPARTLPDAGVASRVSSAPGDAKDVLEAVSEFLERVQTWSGSDPDEVHELAQQVDDALAILGRPLSSIAPGEFERVVVGLIEASDLMLELIKGYKIDQAAEWLKARGFMIDDEPEPGTLAGLLYRLESEALASSAPGDDDLEPGQ